MSSGWSPPNAAHQGNTGQLWPAGAPAPASAPRRWGLVAVVVAVNVASIAAVAAIAYAAGRDSAQVKSGAPSTVSAGPTVSDADVAAAKDKVCHAVDAGQRGSADQGGVVVNGDLNIPFVVRKLNTIVAVQNSLSPAVPSDVSDAAKKYIATATDLTTAALAHAPVDQLVELTKTGNAAVGALFDACGLPR
ncbi:Uncharacterised protein [Mycobacteroides abscessus subsp. abscessus]|nr:Uncharacterised protein [Mycobacteroides abscessus subsp. abscessus]SLE80511.1 Uncharacterised protein [Mycobacteroides abscessus subsp. abscessus]